MASAGEVKVQQLSGPGVPGLETDPPLYHFDIPFGDFDRLVSDPVAFLAEIGLGPDQGIAPNGSVNVMANFSQVWTDSKWERRSIASEDNATSCCYVSDDHMTCHMHEPTAISSR